MRRVKRVGPQLRRCPPITCHTPASGTQGQSCALPALIGAIRVTAIFPFLTCHLRFLLRCCDTRSSKLPLINNSLFGSFSFIGYSIDDCGISLSPERASSVSRMGLTQSIYAENEVAAPPETVRSVVSWHGQFERARFCLQKGSAVNSSSTSTGTSNGIRSTPSSH